MLKTYLQYLEQECIPYFWNRDFNLLKHIKPVELANIKNELAKIITKIDRNLLDDPFIIARYFSRSHFILPAYHFC